MGTFLVWLSLAMASFFLYVLLRDDLPYLRSRKIAARGTVTGHTTVIDEGDRAFSARVSFADAAGTKREFIDKVLTTVPEPSVGASVEVIYPHGRPEKARVPRPALRFVMYAFAIGLNCILLAKLLGMLGD